MRRGPARTDDPWNDPPHAPVCRKSCGRHERRSRAESGWSRALSQTTARPRCAGRSSRGGTSARRSGGGVGGETFQDRRQRPARVEGGFRALYRAGLPARIPATFLSRGLFFPLLALESTSFCHSLGEPIYLSDKYFIILHSPVSSLVYVFEAILITSRLRVVLKTTLSPDS